MEIGMWRDGEAGEKLRGYNISQEERWVDKGRKVVMGKSNGPEKNSVLSFIHRIK